MSKIIIIILAFLALASTASLRSSVSDLELRASRNGHITLKYIKSAGYVVDVDLVKNGRISRKMILSLYHSSVMFTDRCFNFDDYTCKQFDFCSEVRPASYFYPYFNVMGTHINTQLYLDYSAWALDAEAPAFIATNCNSYLGTRNIGTNTIGILGLGFDRGAENNFLGNGTFAIYENEVFHLVFNPNITFRHQVVSKIRTDANWRVPKVAQYNFGGFSHRLDNINLMFDINSEAIGFPESLYNHFLILIMSAGAKCDSNTYQPTCNFNGDLEDLPDLELVIDSRTKIVLTPFMYAINEKTDQFNDLQFILNMKAISPNLNSRNYVTGSYKNTIILGSSVLREYYTLFDTVQSTVSLIRVL